MADSTGIGLQVVFSAKFASDPASIKVSNTQSAAFRRRVLSSSLAAPSVDGNYS